MEAILIEQLNAVETLFAEGAVMPRSADENGPRSPGAHCADLCVAPRRAVQWGADEPCPAEG